MHFSESDTRAKFIDEKLKKSFWGENNIIREYTFTDRRKLLGNKRWKRKSADYILYYKWVKLAIIEAKKYNKSPTDWLEQVKEYAKILHIRFVYATNGKEIYEFDMLSGKGDFIDFYPTPDEIFKKTFGKNNETKEKLLSAPFYISEKKPRYYQEIAIRKTIEAIADHKKRILLTLATWTWKTVIAFQLCYKLFHARFSLEWIGKRRPKILILADRNVLINQAMNTFNPMEKDLIKINWEEIRKKWWKVPKNANIFFSIYQALTGGKTTEDDDFEDLNSEQFSEKYFKQYEKDFFDIIIIDECHRGGARQDGNWAEILQYFSPAIQIGLTATPKRDDNVDTYSYFWEPVYEYSLQAWIDDWFLTPFKIKRIKLSVDELVLTGADKIISWEAKKSFYTQNDMDKNIVIKERTDLVAKTIIDQIGEMEKTIIFCENQSHAADMRDAINKYKNNSHPDYCVRVTSNEGEIWKQYLEHFQDNDKDIPVILTSSQMLTTWVDALWVKNIILDRTIWSIVEYKQIVGRGTRIFDGKDFFTIYDFKGATNDFIDEIWDGNPENIEEISDLKPKKEKKEKNFEIFENISEIPEEPKEKLIVELGAGREVKIIDIETRYLDPATNKHLSTAEFLAKITGEIPKLYENEHIFRATWAVPESREIILKKLSEMWLGKEQFEDLKKIFEAEKSDIFDILLHISYGKNMKNKDERAKNAKNFIKNFDNDLAREFVDFLLNLYAKNGILDFWTKWLPAKIKLFNRGEAAEIGEKFGGLEKLKDAYIELQREIYRE